MTWGIRQLLPRLVSLFRQAVPRPVQGALRLPWGQPLPVPPSSRAPYSEARSTEATELARSRRAGCWPSNRRGRCAKPTGTASTVRSPLAAAGATRRDIEWPRPEARAASVRSEGSSATCASRVTANLVRSNSVPGAGWPRVTARPFGDSQEIGWHALLAAYSAEVSANSLQREKCRSGGVYAGACLVWLCDLATDGDPDAREGESECRRLRPIRPNRSRLLRCAKRQLPSLSDANSRSRSSAVIAANAGIERSAFAVG